MINKNTTLILAW